MKTKILTTIAVAVILAVMPVFAEEFPQTIPSVSLRPYIYMTHSAYDICYNNDGTGAQPNGFDLQLDGCLALPNELRFQEYAFTGENLIYRVVARSCNGAGSLSGVTMTVDGQSVGNCIQETATTGDFASQIPTGCGGSAPAGFSPTYDKAYKCTLTVASSWSGQKTVNLQAYDQSGVSSSMGIAQSWYFNPAVIIDVSTNDHTSSVRYELPVGQSALYPGQTTFSENKLVVTNLASGGVDLWAFISSADFTVNGNCPISNVFDVDGFATGKDYGIKYRCKIGTMENDLWTPITNKVNTAGCTPASCFNAQPVLGSGSTAYTPAFPSIIGNQKSAECQFQLTLPQQCSGSFADGKLQVIVKAV